VNEERKREAISAVSPKSAFFWRNLKMKRLICIMEEIIVPFSIHSILGRVFSPGGFRRQRSFILQVVIFGIFCSTFACILFQRNTVSRVQAASEPGITVDYPLDGSIFPPEITPPTFLWRQSDAAARTWQIDVTFADGAKPIHTASQGEGMQIGEIDKFCVTNNNKLPFLTPEQAAAHTWKPDAQTWETIKRHSVKGPARVVFTGLDQTGHPVGQGQVTLSTSKDPVGAPIFYRDVPMSPSAGAKHVVQPLAPSMMYLINWRVRDIGKPESRVVMHDLPTCANCHSFSGNGKTMGIDVDGPGNDKGIYAVVPVQKQMAIRNEDTISWNVDLSVVKSRVGFMSQVSPDGQYVLTTVAAPGHAKEDNFFIANFLDYRFLQVFYPTRGILAWYNRSTGRRQPLPGADDPRYVQTDGVWSPEGKYIVFARAEAKDPHPAGLPAPLYANDPNEVQIQYSLYRVPFNDGKGGIAEPIAGASNNGMSNNFPKISPDGRWIVFVKCRNGQLMRPDSELYIVPATGGTARRMRSNTSLMNSWHSFSPNGRWMVFSSKSRSPYTQMYLTHIDDNGNDSPPILIDNSTAANRAVNLPEFVNTSQENIEHIEAPAVDLYRLMDEATELQKEGNTDEAILKWKKAVALDPNEPRANNGLGSALNLEGNWQEAIHYLQNAIEERPGYIDAQYNLGAAFMGEHKLQAAIDEWLAAVNIRPDFYEGQTGLGYAYFVAENDKAALSHLRLALDGEPDSVSALSLAASLLATSDDAVLRNGAEAVLLAERASQLSDRKDLAVLDTLSAAYAENARFDEAAETEREALSKAKPETDPAIINRLKAHLQKYLAGQPLRESTDGGTL
jgi:tetratricopeptide (TPR) repeat protein